MSLMKHTLDKAFMAVHGNCMATLKALVAEWLLLYTLSLKNDKGYTLDKGFTAVEGISVISPMPWWKCDPSA